MTLATVPAYDGDALPSLGDRAVVVGAGMAGLLAARVLAAGFDEVTVVEHDRLADDPVARRGTPQARHVHVMLEAGRATLEDLFPGYRRDFRSAGGLEIDAATDLEFHAEGGFLADGPRPLPHYAATRPFHERSVRRRVAALDGVDLRTGYRVTDYRLDDAGTAVTGVVLADGAATETLDAALVVDATGRASRTPAWLARHGYAPPETDEVRIDLAYSTVMLRRPAGDRRALIVTPTPAAPRAAGVLPVEDGRWVVTLAGVHGDHPPTDPAGVAGFAAGLPVSDVARLLDDRPWVDRQVAHYPFPASLRRRYEALDRFPDGLVVVGDAVASFNPLYGQGMSVAALEAVLLGHALVDGVAGLGPRFFDRAASVVDAAWVMAVGGDFRFPETTGPRPRGTALVNRYVARLNRRAQADGALRDAFMRVLMMERPPTTLFRPGVLWRVFRS